MAAIFGHFLKSWEGKESSFQNEDTPQAFVSSYLFGNAMQLRGKRRDGPKERTLKAGRAESHRSPGGKGSVLLSVWRGESDALPHGILETNAVAAPGARGTAQCDGLGSVGGHSGLVPAGLESAAVTAGDSRPAVIAVFIAPGRDSSPTGKPVAFCFQKNNPGNSFHEATLSPALMLNAAHAHPHAACCWLCHPERLLLLLSPTV